jgi:hypothetical protein
MCGREPKASGMMLFARKKTVIKSYFEKDIT